MRDEYDFSQGERGKLRLPHRREFMEKKRYTYWHDEDMWIGYLEEYPDYWTQGETFEELKNNLRDIYSELASGNISFLYSCHQVKLKCKPMNKLKRTLLRPSCLRRQASSFPGGKKTPGCLPPQA